MLNQRFVLALYLYVFFLFIVMLLPLIISVPIMAKETKKQVNNNTVEVLQKEVLKTQQSVQTFVNMLKRIVTDAKKLAILLIETTEVINEAKNIKEHTEHKENLENILSAVKSADTSTGETKIVAEKIKNSAVKAVTAVEIVAEKTSAISNNVNNAKNAKENLITIADEAVNILNEITENDVSLLLTAASSTAAKINTAISATDEVLSKLPKESENKDESEKKDEGEKKGKGEKKKKKENS